MGLFQHPSPFPPRKIPGRSRRAYSSMSLISLGGNAAQPVNIAGDFGYFAALVPTSRFAPETPVPTNNEPRMAWRKIFTNQMSISYEW